MSAGISPPNPLTAFACCSRLAGPINSLMPFTPSLLLLVTAIRLIMADRWNSPWECSARFSSVSEKCSQNGNCQPCRRCKSPLRWPGLTDGCPLANHQPKKSISGKSSLLTNRMSTRHSKIHSNAGDWRNDATPLSDWCSLRSRIPEAKLSGKKIGEPLCVQVFKTPWPTQGFISDR
jgi:hypothetical protein